MEYVDKTKLTGSCYRIVRLPKKADWNLSQHYCRVDGASYLVIDDESEHDIVKELVADLENSTLLFLDFMRESFRDLFRTSIGETLHEVGYIPGSDKLNWDDFRDRWNHSLVLNSTTVNYEITYSGSRYEKHKGWPFCEKRIRNDLIPDEGPRPTSPRTTTYRGR